MSLPVARAILHLPEIGPIDAPNVKTLAVRTAVNANRVRVSTLADELLTYLVGIVARRVPDLSSAHAILGALNSFLMLAL